MRTQESNRLGVAREAVRDNIQGHLDWLDKQIDGLIQAIKDHISHHPNLKHNATYWIPYPDSANAPSGSSWLTMPILAASPTADKPQHSRALTLGIMNQAAASGANLDCPR